jgi:hypothetical protein
MAQSKHNAKQSQPPSSEIPAQRRWAEMLLSAIRENRCGWRRARNGEIADLSALELRGYVALRWLPEQETYFADESDPHKPLPGSLTVEPAGLYWKPTPEGCGWLERVQALASERRAAADAEAAVAEIGGAADPSAGVTPDGTATSGQAAGQAQSVQRQTSAARQARDDWESLSDRQRECLLALFELKAFRVDDRRTANEVAERALGRHATKDGLVRVLADLVQRNWIKSQSGCRGGYWLPPAGRKLVAKHHRAT